jgi:hypothetical protein
MTPKKEKEKAMDKRQVTEKIKKLLRLSESPNENEAALAAVRAQEMMEKYQISIMDTDDGGELSTADDFTVDQKGRFEPWYLAFFVGLATLYDLNPYLKRNCRKNGKNYTKLQVIGLETDAEVFRYAFQFLTDTTLRLYKQELEKKKRAAGAVPSRKQINTFRYSFCQGCTTRILKKMRAAKQSQAQTDSTALVVVKTEAIERYKKDNNLRMRSEKVGGGPRAFNGSAYQAGYRAGGNINLNPALS